MQDKPIISNQHGALVMAFVPFLYAIFKSHVVFNHLWLGLAWLCLYLFSYPFFGIFSKKNNRRQKKWAVIYFTLSMLFSFPLLLSDFSILQFALLMLPLALIQIYYAKQKNERHLLNDIAGILTFGIVGMSAYYLATGKYQISILIDPTLFFITTTLYIKSVARERKNPIYYKLSLGSHILLGLTYFTLNSNGIAFAYLIGLLRALIVSKQHLNIKQIGMLEFLMVTIFVIALVI